jgi:hypothetical protein
MIRRDALIISWAFDRVIGVSNRDFPFHNPIEKTGQAEKWVGAQIVKKLPKEWVPGTVSDRADELDRQPYPERYLLIPVHKASSAAGIHKDCTTRWNRIDSTVSDRRRCTTDHGTPTER